MAFFCRSVFYTYMLLILFTHCQPRSISILWHFHYWYQTSTDYKSRAITDSERVDYFGFTTYYFVLGCYLFSYIFALPSAKIPRFGVVSSSVFGAVINFVLILLKPNSAAANVMSQLCRFFAISTENLMLMSLMNASTPFPDPTNGQLIHSRIKLWVMAEFFCNVIWRPVTIGVISVVSFYAVILE